MSKAYLILCGIALVILSVAGFGGWMLSLPAATTAAIALPIPHEETYGMLASLRPAKRERPLIAVIGISDATETTDYLVPTGILRHADVADVMMLATDAALSGARGGTGCDDCTVRCHPEGADFVIVPAMSRDDDPAVLAWLRAQAAKGATVIGICAGAKVVGAAGLLDGKRETTH